MQDCFSNTLTFEDVRQMTGPLSFNLMLKPAGSLCNLGCNYCYYLDKSEIYGGHEPRMTLEMLEKTVKDNIEANDVPEVQFNWHGGEPLIIGIDFFRKAVEFEKKHADGKTIYNTIQTNGTLITREWAKFLRDNRFLVGVSIDGPKDIHDRYRKDKAKNPTFDQVVKGISLMNETGVEFNTMTTVNKASEGRGLEVYQFLKSLGSRYMQFMPVLEHIKFPVSKAGNEIKGARPFIVDPKEEGSRIAPWSVSDIGFGKFMCDIFDWWVRNDVGRYFVGLFDATLANWCGVQPGTCVYAQTCGGNAVMEHNGDIYPCDHFVYRKYLLGNIKDKSVKEMMTSDEMVRFGIDKRNTLPAKCRRCEWLHICNGECPKHRFNKTESGETGLNALCAGYRLFYTHSAPYMDFMKSLIAQEQAPAGVIPWARNRSI